ncbi:hypothetical protein D3C84_590700 [compost metagenome]
MPAIEQADRLRPAQPLAECRCLASARLDEEVREQRLTPFNLDPMSLRRGLNAQHPTFNQLNARQAQVLAQSSIKARAVQQEFDVLRMLLTVPRHLPLRRQRRIRQRLMQTSTAQGLQHPQRNAFQRGEPAPLADQRHGVTEPPQAQGNRRPRRPRAQNQDHAPKRRSGPR